MKNRKLKGLTLMETVLYVGLTASIMIIIVSFMLSTQESSQRTQSRVNIHQASSFAIQHIYYSMGKTLSINTEQSVFENDNGVLALNLDGGTKIYKLENSRVLYNSIPITPTNVVVRKMYLEPVLNRKDEVVAAKVTFEISSINKFSQTKIFNFLAIVR